jgi:hypothetical protein
MIGLSASAKSDLLIIAPPKSLITAVSFGQIEFLRFYFSDSKVETSYYA